MNIPTVTHNGLSFINLNKPTEAEMKFLNTSFGFSMLNLEDYLYKTQIPKIEIYKDYSLFVMDMPFISAAERSTAKPAANTDLSTNRVFLPNFTKAARGKRISVGEVDFFIGKDYIVVLHDERTPMIDEVFEMCKLSSKNREELMGQGSVYLFYRIVDILVDAMFSYVEDITNTIDFIDKQMESGTSAKVIDDISMTRRNIVVFETMIKPVLSIFADLEKGKYAKLNGEMAPYWSNILDHVQKIWERLEDNKELIAGLASSHESILTNRNNELVKFLTVITSIAFPFVIVNNLYSMNVARLPYADEPWIVSVLFLIIFAGGIGVISYFKYKDWL